MVGRACHTYDYLNDYVVMSAHIYAKLLLIMYNSDLIGHRQI